MHDFDRTQLEAESDAFESDQFEFAEELGLQGDMAMEGPFDEAEEMDLAAELLSVSSEEELDQFIGKVVKGAWRRIKKAGSAVSRVAGPLTGVLRGVAKSAMPFLGGALGSFIPIPGVGTAVGTALGSALGKALEAEFEGMNPEDQEFEKARRFVRMAGTAAQQAALAPAGADPQATVRTAVMTAARQHVPSLSAAAGSIAPAAMVSGRRERSGRWVRRGKRIILLGV
jgi:hypothetical protein